ncbi:MAG: VOC family protein [Frankia sp.]|nr:VOC family protein [Frankia sp.]
MSSQLRVQHVVVDCMDLKRQATFYGGLLGLEEQGSEADWVDLGPVSPAGPRLLLVAVPEPKAAKNRVHLDIAVPDLNVATHRVLTLGGSAATEPYFADHPWRVMRDPEGQEFCLVTD